MAASITLSSPTVAADGKTLTATISGGTGTYSITDATGITPHLTAGNAYGFGVSSVSVSGSTLTVNVTTPFGSGEACRLDIASSSNLTDTGANTPTGQTNVTVTNNSAVTVTTVLATTNPEKFEFGGIPIDTSGVVRNDQKGVWGNNSMTTDAPLVSLVTDATEVAALAYSGSATAYRRDGATSDTTAPSTGFWSAKPLTTTPLAAGKHLFVVNPGQYFYGVRLSGGTRTMHAVPTTKRGLLAADYTPINATAATEVTVSGAGQVGLTSAAEVVTGIAGYLGLALEFSFVGTGFELATVLHNVSVWHVEVDGDKTRPLVTPGSAAVAGNNGLAPLVEGLTYGTHYVKATFVGSGTNSTHRGVRIINGTVLAASAAISDTTLSVASVTHIAVNDWVRIDHWEKREWRQVTAITGTGPYTLTLDGALTIAHASGAGVASASAPAGTIATWVDKAVAGRRIGVVGDSTLQCSNPYGSTGATDPNGIPYGSYDARLSPAYRAFHDLGFDVINVAIQGTDSTTMASRKTDLFTYGRGVLDDVFMQPGANDINSNTTTPAQYQTNVEAMVAEFILHLRDATRQRLHLACPNTPVGTTSAKGLSVSVIRGILQTVAAANPTTCRYVGDIYDDGLVLSVGNDLGDALHYSAAGQAKLGQNMRVAVVPQFMSAGCFA